jgi:NAD(P)-dependent dehydrogenase (short-subunit alcohol dehydrogenase family)
MAARRKPRTDAAMTKKLDGKVAIVTGAGSSGPGYGTGKAISVLFAREGAKVVLVDMHEGRALETKRLIAEEGGEASIVVADLTKASECKRIVSEATKIYGGVDILINNAGFPPCASLLDTTEEQWLTNVAVNLGAPFFLTQAVIPTMAERGGGSIVYLSSIAAMRHSGGGGAAAYSATKSGLLGLMTDAAGVYGHHKIRINTIAPGMVATPMQSQQLEKTGMDLGALNKMLLDATSLGIPGDAWDIANAALFFASDDSKYVTAVLMPVDAGKVQR